MSSRDHLLVLDLWIWLLEKGDLSLTIFVLLRRYLFGEPLFSWRNDTHIHSWLASSHMFELRIAPVAFYTFDAALAWAFLIVARTIPVSVQKFATLYESFRRITYIKVATYPRQTTIRVRPQSVRCYPRIHCYSKYRKPLK